MRIAVDLDDVIFDTERNFRVLCEIYDADNYKQNSIIDNSILNLQYRYNWSKEESGKFYANNVFHIEETSNFIPGAIHVLKLLKKMGHELYIISAKGIFSEKQIEISKRRLVENDLDIFKKYIFKAEDKAKYIKKYNIDIMIDDNLDICNSLKDICMVLYLKDESFISIVCFSNQTRLKINSKSQVIQLSGINKAIKAHDKVILNEDINTVKEKIVDNNITDKTIRKKHVKMIKDKK